MPAEVTQGHAGALAEVGAGLDRCHRLTVGGVRGPAALGRPGATGQMTYFAPDTPAWEALDVGHPQGGAWLLSGRVATFYDGLRWPGWREEAAALDCSQGTAVYPFLWSEDARADLPATSRRPVPMREVLALSRDFARRTGAVDSGFLGEV
ncbi:hypothetical protein CLM85_12385 [Streptomyces albidoflavus]|nr:hypothetical protein CLM81_19320 [Streptomyces albidoflavus]PAX84664.1 hypothetical protein CLM82_33160 [Streptomyces albidoflavus]PBO17638.1 hypothetical protein CLM83_16985 [Streptomyces albidoflavus]PBO24093.1 hypothetical protein CLM85_12385 [Streptomyces albidoflavus]PBO27666.1 hypothetical protein CLM84_24585 [Streptomyces albidoflavus]